MAAIWSRAKRSRVLVAGIAARVVVDPDLVSMPMRERPENVAGKEAG